MIDLQSIKDKLSRNEIDEAIATLDEYIAQNDKCEEAYILRGNAYRKLGNWKKAIENYCYAKEINPDGAGATAYENAMQILEFYNTDLYNP